MYLHSRQGRWQAEEDDEEDEEDVALSATPELDPFSNQCSWPDRKCSAS